MSNIKIFEGDRWFSKCVREAAGWKCERCGAQHEENSQGLHCAHYMTRGKWATRFDPDNVAALCYGCHSYIDSNPHKKMEWFDEYLGESTAQIIREKSEDTKHGLKKLKKEISAHYRNEHKRLISLRKDGNCGRIMLIGFQ